MVTHAWFGHFILGCILTNTFMMAIEHHGMDPGFKQFLEGCNILLLLIFTGEMVLKVAGLGVLEYLSDKFNMFDCWIVWVGLIELASGDSTLSVLRTFRLMRVLRTLKILHANRGIKALMENIVMGLSALADFLLVLALFVFIFAVLVRRCRLTPGCPVDRAWFQRLDLQYDAPLSSTTSNFFLRPYLLGMQLFGANKGFVGSRQSFDNMWDAFLIVFQMLTGTDWYIPMWMAMSGAGQGHYPKP